MEWIMESNGFEKSKGAFPPKYFILKLNIEMLNFLGDLTTRLLFIENSGAELKESWFSLYSSLISLYQVLLKYLFRLP